MLLTEIRPVFMKHMALVSYFLGDGGLCRPFNQSNSGFVDYSRHSLAHIVYQVYWILFKNDESWIIWTVYHGLTEYIFFIRM